MARGSVGAVTVQRIKIPAGEVEVGDVLFEGPGYEHPVTRVTPEPDDFVVLRVSTAIGWVPFKVDELVEVTRG